MLPTITETERRKSWGVRPHFWLLQFALVAAGAPIHAEPTFDHHDVNGHRVRIGPFAGALRQDGRWDSQVGAELHYTQVDDSRRVPTLGLALGVSSFAAAETAARLTFDTYVGMQVNGMNMLGLGVGGSLDLFREGASEGRLRTTLWAHVGVVPYVAASFPIVETEGVGIELGVRIPFTVVGW